MQALNQFPPFAEFVKSLQKRPVNNFLKGIGTQKNEAIEQMRTYLQKYYKNVKAITSFVDQEGQIWDCFPQSMLRVKNRQSKIVSAPAEYPGNAIVDLSNDNLQSTEAIDPYGNQTTCPEDCIPVRRITLENMLSFDSIESFNEKKVEQTLFTESKLSDEKMLSDIDDGHRYAGIRQAAKNRGGSCALSLWQPSVNGTQGHLFSLSQLWVVGGNGSQRQTVEVGWQVCPQRWRTNKPVLFIYWTADGYNTTGSYNLDGGYFQQTNNKWRLGGTLDPVSTIGGNQVDIITEWFFINNAWWLYLNKQAVGYYPGRLFKGGTLSSGADMVIVGGEVSGNNSWSAMGSGMFAQQGYRQSAYVRNAQIMAPNGSLHDLQDNPVLTAPRCFSLAPGNNPAWKTSFFYGGPGGINCG